MSGEDYFLGASKLFQDNQKVVVPAEVRQRLGISKTGVIKLMWFFNHLEKRVYVKVNTPSTGSYDTSVYPG